MKIEKLNENQIRCKLSREDLAKRQLKLSELTYGSEKTKALFQEMIAQAKGELDFDAENVPLMIEAIPVSPDCLVLVVTKIEDPDELDTRFSSFTEDPDEEDGSFTEVEENPYADEILSCFDHITELIGEALKGDIPEEEKEALNVSSIIEALSRVYSFNSLDTVSELAKVLVPFYNGKNSIFKDPKESKYYLTLSISKHSPVDFNKVCNILSEYGTMERVNYARLSYFEEHCEVLVKDNALQVFAKI
ncbi:MAG: adaptor protein MecA [Lachnospiraceae bacterium]|nr:adaptor protein MecA [Lachnospiraceae bacterium]